VLNDVMQGYVSPEKAVSEYGVSVIPSARDYVIDQEATAHLRSRRHKEVQS
jgi:hypothetical protein